MKLLTVQVPDELHRELFSAAANSDRSASLYVREAIREKLGREAGRVSVTAFPAAPSVDPPSTVRELTIREKLELLKQNTAEAIEASVAGRVPKTQRSVQATLARVRAEKGFE